MFADTHSYDHPDDDYVLKGTLLSALFAGVADTWLIRGVGSCGVEYRLALTTAGYEKYGYSTFSRMTGSDDGSFSRRGYTHVYLQVLI